MPGPASILVIAKKKAAGPGGFFDPMAEHGDMAMGPMMFELSEEETEETPTPAKAMMSMKPDLSKMDFKSAAAKLREIADQLDQSSVKHAKQAADLKAIAGGEDMGEEEEDVEDEPSEAPAKVMAGPPKKGPPAFLKPKPMKY